MAIQKIVFKGNFKKKVLSGSNINEIIFSLMRTKSKHITDIPEFHYDY